MKSCLHKSHFENFHWQILCLVMLLLSPGNTQYSFAQIYYSPQEPMDTTTVAFSPNGEYVLSAGFAGDIRLWRKDRCDLQGIGFIHDPRIPPNEKQNEFPPYFSVRRGILSLVWSPDGNKFAFGLRDRTVRVYSFDPTLDQHRLFEEYGVFHEHMGGLRAVAYSPDGRFLASGGHDESILLWNAESRGSSVRRFCCHTGMVNTITFSPDGKRVLSGSTDGKVRVWDVKTSKTVKEFQLEGSTYAVAYSPDGRFIGASEDSYTKMYGRQDPIVLWNAKTGKEERQFLGHTEGSWAIQFHPNGRHLGSAGQDGQVIIWDLDTADVVQVLKHPQEQQSYRAISFSPNGRYIVAGAKSGSLPLWDVETGQVVREFGKCSGKLN